MALILRLLKTHTDKQGYKHSSFYAVIDRIHVDKRNRMCDFSVDIYKSVENREDGLCDSISLNIPEDYFDEFIALDGGVFKNAYEFAMLDERLVNWKSDE